MGRKRSKKALKNRIKQLESMNRELQYSENRIKERFRELGSAPEINTFDGVPCVVAEVKPQAWGNYALVNPEYLEDPDLHDQIERGLVEQIVESLIKNEYVQFMHTDPGLLYHDRGVIAAKLFVFPWEKVTQKSIKLAARISKEDIDGESNPRT